MTTAAPLPETSVERDPPPAAADNDSENASDHDRSVKDDSPPTKLSKKRTHDDSDKDEPETKSAREDLRQTRISDRERSKSPRLENATAATADVPNAADDDEKMDEGLAVKIPEPRSPIDEEMKDRLSPKKKRPRDKDDEDDNEGGLSRSTNGEKSADGSTNGGSILPMKKRHRDASQDSILSEGKRSLEIQEPPTASSLLNKPLPTDLEPSKRSDENKPLGANAGKTSTEAFKNSGFAALASAASPFAAAAASKPSVFAGSAAQKPSGFGALASSNGGTSLSGFGSLASSSTSGFGTASSGGFGGLSGGFGGGFGGGFSSGFGSGPKLTSFAAPASKADLLDPSIASTSKKEKAFGAPESSEEEDSGDDGSDAEAGADEDEDDQPAAEEKKKFKASKAPILDGEEEDITVWQGRAKLFVSDNGWKERGVGALKINIPRSTSKKMLWGGDDDEEPLITPEKDENAEDDGNEKDDDTQTPAKPSYTARLIMRQDSTHRVILNSVVLKEMKFTEKPTNSAIGILFTALEDGKPVNLQFKMNATNAKEFLREIGDIQRKL